LFVIVQTLALDI